MGQKLPVENYTPPDDAPECTIPILVELQMPGTGRKDEGGMWHVTGGK